MAGLSICYNPCSINKDKPAWEALINDSGIPAVFFTLTLALPQVFASTQAPVSALNLPNRYTNKYLQRLIKLVLKLFVWGQKQSQFQASFVWLISYSRLKTSISIMVTCI